MRTRLNNTDLYNAWWNQSQTHAHNQWKTLMFEGHNLFAEQYLNDKSKNPAIGILYNGNQKFVLVPRDKLSYNAKTQRYHLIWYLEGGYKKQNPKIHFIVENIYPTKKEHHLKNMQIMEKDIKRIYNRIQKGTCGWDNKINYKSLIVQYVDYVKLFDLSEISAEWILVQRMVLRLT